MKYLLFYTFLLFSLLLLPTPSATAQSNLPSWLGDKHWDFIQKETCLKMDWEWLDEDHEDGPDCIIPADIETRVVEAVDENNVEAIRKYLEAGMPVDYGPARFYYAPIIVHAYGMKRCEIVDLLIKNGADMKKLEFYAAGYKEPRCGYVAPDRQKQSKPIGPIQP